METDSLVENIDPFQGQGQGGDISTLDRRNTELKGRFEDLKVWKKVLLASKYGYCWVFISKFREKFRFF